MVKLCLMVNETQFDEPQTIADAIARLPMREMRASDIFENGEDTSKCRDCGDEAFGFRYCVPCGGVSL